MAKRSSSKKPNDDIWTAFIANGPIFGQPGIRNRKKVRFQTLKEAFAQVESELRARAEMNPVVPGVKIENPTLADVPMAHGDICQATECHGW